MRDNPKENLKRLEEELLQEDLENFEEFSQPLDEEEQFIREIRALIGDDKKSKKGKAYRNYNGAGAQTRAASVHNTDRTDVSAYQYGEELEEEEAPRKSGKGLVILAVVETLGILAVVAYWMVRFF